MSTVVEFTLSEMILLAAHKLEEQGQSPFSAEELIVASWKQFPRAFGLKGYGEQYPDSNRVLSSIMGEKGMTRRGWLSKMGQKLYSLSKEGKRVVQRMASGDEDYDDQEESPRLPRDQEKLIIALLDSSAAEKISEKKPFELSFADACRFWSITENLSADALDARLAKIETALDNLDRVAAAGEVDLGHREVTPADAELLREVHEHLLERFSRHLSLLRSRSK